ncbi:glycosyltransferase [Hyphococcus sp.]|uniref:glycosyltransferase n=1 Tax=Hyphococcus sp. TaxID=2038636 RepID=UPI003CCBF29A
MRILFLHDNFPAQFGVFGQYLSSKGWEVWFGTQRDGASSKEMKVFNYAPHREVTEKVHPYVGGFEKAVLNGQAVARMGLKLKEKGFYPDIVMAHSGWGPGLFVKDVWPKAKYVGYFEWYYSSDAPDLMFLGGGDRGMDDELRTRIRNSAIQSDLVSCDFALCPTQFQKAQFPECFQHKIKVMHDGIDTDTYKPSPSAKLVLPDLDLSHVDEIITYATRGMEPYRGFPQFMKALENVLAARPNAHVVIVGDDRVAYGKKLEKGDSYKARALKECDLDWDRVHFTGLLPRPDYLKVLQASSVHAYFTIPFVLSWSMMESMSVGCTIVTSDVEPVSEMAGDKAPTLRQVDHRRPEEIANAIIALLEDRDAAQALGAAARQFIVDGYSKKEIFPQKEAWLMSGALV